jgi:Fe(3+) dicitrate transport protein
LVSGEGLHTDKLTTIDVSAVWFTNKDIDIKLLVRNITDESAIVSHRPYGARPNLPRTLLAQVKLRF